MFQSELYRLVDVILSFQSELYRLDDVILLFQSELYCLVDVILLFQSEQGEWGHKVTIFDRTYYKDDHFIRISTINKSVLKRAYAMLAKWGDISLRHSADVYDNRQALGFSIGFYDRPCHLHNTIEDRPNKYNDLAYLAYKTQ